MAKASWSKSAAVALLVVTQSALAQESPAARPVEDVPPGEDKIVAIREGDKAPFSGQLFSNDTALRWGHWLEQYKFRLSYDVETQRQLDQVRLDYFSAVIEVDKKKYDAVTSLQHDTIRDLQAKLAEPDPWYESFGFGLGVGVVGSIIVAGLATLVVTQVKL